MSKRYQAKPFSQNYGQKPLYAVWDWQTNDNIIEPNGMVLVDKQKPTQAWAKYLNGNLPYSGEGRTIENIFNSLSPLT